MTKKLLPLFLILSVMGCSYNGCGEKAKEVIFAKSLSDNQLSTLFKNTKTFFKYKERIHYDGPIPKQFSDLGIKAIQVHKGIHLRLQGCLDSWVDLVVYEMDENPRIELWYENSEKEILWKPQNNQLVE